MRKLEIVKEVNKVWPDTFKMVNVVFRTMNKAFIKKEKVSISGFGTFIVKQTKAREGMDWVTGKRKRTNPKFKVKFIPSKLMEIRINNENIINPGL